MDYVSPGPVRGQRVENKICEQCGRNFFRLLGEQYKYCVKHRVVEFRPPKHLPRPEKRWKTAFNAHQFI